MKTDEALREIERYNLWRRGKDDNYRAHPKTIGIALDIVCSALREEIASRKAARNIFREIWPQEVHHEAARRLLDALT